MLGLRLCVIRVVVMVFCMVSIVGLLVRIGCVVVVSLVVCECFNSIGWVNWWIWVMLEFDVVVICLIDVLV